MERPKSTPFVAGPRDPLDTSAASDLQRLRLGGPTGARSAGAVTAAGPTPLTLPAVTAEPDRKERARSFGAIADDYNRFRPGPPEAAVAWLLPERPGTAVDLGAGTGALSEVLAGLVPYVVAVEPDHRMLSVLGRRAPGVHGVVGKAEEIPLRDSSVDVVAVSSAWHWMDQAQAVAEAGRVLRQDGVLGVMWSGPDRSVPWVAEVLAASRRPTAGPGGPRTARRLEVPSVGPFHRPEACTFTASVQYRVDDLVGLAASYSSVITLPESEKKATLARVAARVAEVAAVRDVEWVALPLRCQCWRASAG